MSERADTAYLALLEQVSDVRANVFDWRVSNILVEANKQLSVILVRCLTDLEAIPVKDDEPGLKQLINAECALLRSTIATMGAVKH